MNGPGTEAKADAPAPQAPRPEQPKQEQHRQEHPRQEKPRQEHKPRTEKHHGLGQGQQGQRDRPQRPPERPAAVDKSELPAFLLRPVRKPEPQPE